MGEGPDSLLAVPYRVPAANPGFLAKAARPVTRGTDARGTAAAGIPEGRASPAAGIPEGRVSPAAGIPEGRAKGGGPSRAPSIPPRVNPSAESVASKDSSWAITALAESPGLSSSGSSVNAGSSSVNAGSSGVNAGISSENTGMSGVNACSSGVNAGRSGVNAGSFGVNASGSERPATSESRWHGPLRSAPDTATNDDVVDVRYINVYINIYIYIYIYIYLYLSTSI